MFSPFERMVAGRYLRARRKEGFISVLAGFSFLGIMLGVATLIVVNAVMSGFSTKLKDRLHGVLTDVVVETDRPDGFEIVREHKRAATPDELAQRSRYYNEREKAGIFYAQSWALAHMLAFSGSELRPLPQVSSQPPAELRKAPDDEPVDQQTQNNGDDDFHFQ